MEMIKEYKFWGKKWSYLQHEKTFLTAVRIDKKS